MSFLRERGFKREWPHGTRARYVGQKCRCVDCKAANVRYYHERMARAKALAGELELRGGVENVEQLWTAPDGTVKRRTYQRACRGVGGQPCPTHSHLRKDSIGDICAACRSRLAWNGLVDAAPARAHLQNLSDAGVGYKTVADAASVAASVVAKICSGARTKVRADVERRILAVDAGAAADHAYVDAAATRALIDELLEYGFTKSELAKRLGSMARKPALQLRIKGRVGRGGGARVLVVTAARVECMHAEAIEDLRGRLGLVDGEVLPSPREYLSEMRVERWGRRG